VHVRRTDWSGRTCAPRTVIEARRDETDDVVEDPGLEPGEAPHVRVPRGDPTLREPRRRGKGAVTVTADRVAARILGHADSSGVESGHGRRPDPQRLPRVHGRAWAHGHPSRTVDPEGRPDDAVHGQRDAAAAALPARGGPSRGAAPRGQPDVPAGAGHRGGRRQPAHDVLRDARELEPRRLLQGRPDPAVLDVPHRAGRPLARPHLRLVLHRGPCPRHPQGHRVGSDLDRALRGGRDPGRPDRGGQRGERRRTGDGGCSHRVLRQEELVVPRRHRGGDAGR
jgi:hypothetical protein